MKTTHLIIGLLVTLGATAKASSFNFNRAAFDVSNAANTVVVLGDMLDTQGQQLIGSGYFRSKGRICMRVGAILEATKDLANLADRERQDFQARTGKIDPIRESDVVKAKSTVDASVGAATFCDGTIDGTDDQHDGISLNKTVVTTEAQLRQIIDQVVNSSQSLKDAYEARTYSN